MLRRTEERSISGSMKAFLDMFREYKTSEIEFKAEVDHEPVRMRHHLSIDHSLTVGQPPDGINPEHLEYVGKSNSRLNVGGLKIPHAFREDQLCV